jgi:hypothetical protein
MMSQMEIVSHLLHLFWPHSLLSAVNLTGSAGLARRLGMTIIPGKYIVSVSVNKDS